MAVTLNGNNLTHIVDVDFVEIKTVSLPEWVNDATPDIDINIWNLKPLKIIYTLRVTNALKWILDQILTGHTQKTLVDTDYGINTNVFMIELEAVWDGDINYAKPWLITIGLIPC